MFPLGRLPGRRPEDTKPIQVAWIRPPVLTLVDGPYCLFMWDRVARDPDDPSREYKWDHFDVVRVEDGFIQEHWDEARLEPPEAERKQ